MVRDLYGLDEQTVYLSPAPLYHAAPLRFCMTVNRVGGTVIVMEKFDPETALRLIETHAALIFCGAVKTPTPRGAGHEIEALPAGETKPLRERPHHSRIDLDLRSHSKPDAPISSSMGAVEGSGLATGPGIPDVPQPMEIVFVFIVTAPVSAKALPHAIVAPVFREMLSCARIFPSNAVPLPRVAELPTCQKMLDANAPLIRTT